MATQNFKRNLLLNLYRKGKKALTLVVCLLLPLKREIKIVWHLQPISPVWRPLAFLPVTLLPCIFNIPPPIIFVHVLTLCFKKRIQVHVVHCLCQPWHFLMELWFPLVEKCTETKALCFHCYLGEAVFSYSQVRELGNIYKWNHIYAYLFTNIYIYIYLISISHLLCYCCAITFTYAIKPKCTWYLLGF